jgi:hypothetical protein
MGMQQNPEGIYVPPGDTRRYPLNTVPRCACGAELHRNISIRTGECQPCRNKRQGAGKAL